MEQSIDIYLFIIVFYIFLPTLLLFGREEPAEPSTKRQS